jgi:predicted GNAT family acetyltransferase
MTSELGKAPVVHDRNGRHFVVRVESVEAHLDYELAGTVMVITHTIVPPEIGGRGIAGELVAAAFEAARAQGWKVRPQCSYAAAWVRKHPEVADLIAV